MTDNPDPKLRTPSGHVITEITVSTERTIRLREFENRKVFVSAKALIIQGLGEPDTVQAALLAQVNGWADAEEVRVRGAPTASHPPLSAIATALPPADTPSPEGRAGPSIPAPESPGPSSRGNDLGAGQPARDAPRGAVPHAPLPPPGPAENCPDHKRPFRWQPPGVSRRTGKAYEGFWSCPMMGCRRKPKGGR